MCIRDSTGPLRGQLEYRYFHDQFDAGHFDNLYELDRARLDLGSGRVQAKDARLAREADLSGVFGRATADVGQFVQAGAAYQYLAGGDEPKQEVRAEAELSPRALARVPRLRAARAYYQKNNIGARLNRAGTGDDGFFESTEDTFYGYALGLELAGEVTVVWDTRYVFARGADGRLQRRKVLGIETVFFF